MSDATFKATFGVIAAGVESDHNKLSNLDYGKSGHTGFASSTDVDTLNSELDGVKDSVTTLTEKTEILKTDGDGSQVLANNGEYITVGGSGAISNIETYNLSSAFPFWHGGNIFNTLPLNNNNKVTDADDSIYELVQFNEYVKGIKIKKVDSINQYKCTGSIVCDTAPANGVRLDYTIGAYVAGTTTSLGAYTSYFIGNGVDKTINVDVLVELNVPSIDTIVEFKISAQHNMGTGILMTTADLTYGLFYNNLQVSKTNAVGVVSPSDESIDGTASTQKQVNEQFLNAIQGLQEGGVTSVNGQTGDVVVNVPSKTSDITNDSGFINKLVNDLVNYYNSTQTYTKDEVNGLVSSFSSISIQVVQVLPEIGETNVIYFVPSENVEINNNYDEYLYINDSYELVGSTKIDLSQYAKISYVDGKIAPLEIKLNLIKTDGDGTLLLSNDATYKSLDNMTIKHDLLINRDSPNQHPISAIQGLQIELDSKLSQEYADGTFVTKLTSDLMNYYTKQETYTKNEVNDLFNYAVKLMKVDVLPEFGASNVIFLVPATTAETNDIYDEYIYVNGAYELIGNTAVDLSQYALKTYVDSEVSTRFRFRGNYTAGTPADGLGEYKLYDVVVYSNTFNYLAIYPSTGSPTAYTSSTATSNGWSPFGKYVYKSYMASTVAVTRNNTTKMWLTCTDTSTTSEPVKNYVKPDVYIEADNTLYDIRGQVASLAGLLLKADKTYTDAQDLLNVLKTGDTMTGGLRIQGVEVPLTVKTVRTPEGYRTILVALENDALGNEKSIFEIFASEFGQWGGVEIKAVNPLDTTKNFYLGMYPGEPLKVKQNNGPYRNIAFSDEVPNGSLLTLKNSTTTAIPNTGSVLTNTVNLIVDRNEIGATFTSNVITLPIGRYRVTGTVNVLKTGNTGKSVQFALISNGVVIQEGMKNLDWGTDTAGKNTKAWPGYLIVENSPLQLNLGVLASASGFTYNTDEYGSGIVLHFEKIR